MEQETAISGSGEAKAKAPGREFIRLVARSVGLALVAGVLAAGFSLMLENEYRAEAMLLLAPMPINQPEVREPAMDRKTSPAAEVGFLLVRPLSVLDYEVLLKSDEIASALRDKLDQLLEASGKKSGNVRLEDVRKAMGVQTRIQKQTVYDVVYQPVISLTFKANSPDAAAAVANEWARLGVELSEKLTTKGREGLLSFLRASFGEKETELKSAEKELETVEGEMRVEVATERLKKLDEHATILQVDLAKVNTDIADAQGQVELLKAEREKTSELNNLRKAVPDEAYWLLSETGKKMDSSKVLVSEEANEVFTKVRTEEVLAQGKLQGLLQKKDALEKELTGAKGQVSELQQKLATQSRLRDEAKRKADTYSQQFIQLALNYGAAQIAEAQKTPDLKIASAATPPERKIGPFRSLIVLAAMFIALLVFPAHFYLTRALRKYSRLLEAQLSQG